MISHKVVLAAILVAGLLGSQAAMGQLPTGQSPIERTYTGIKILDAYFGTEDEKMEVEPGDLHVPFTVVFTNVGSSEIIGLTGALSMPINFGPPGSSMTAIKADTDASILAGKSFAMTFYVDVGGHSKIGAYKGSIKVDYSRLRETGQRSHVHAFDFELVGRSTIDASTADPFVSSFRYNDIVIDLFNSGSASTSGVRVDLNSPSMTKTESQNSEGIIILDSSWNVGNIEAVGNKSVTTSVYVPGNLEGKTIRLPLTIKYFDAQGHAQTVERTVDIYVRGLVDLFVYGVNVIDLSGKQTIIGNILNEGNEEALFTFITVKPLKGSNIKTAMQFIDDIDTDSPVPFNIPVEFDGTPQYGRHDITLEIRYKDGIRNETVKTHNSTVFIPEPAAEEDVGLLTLIEIIVPVGFAAVIATAFIIRRKRKS